MMVCCPTEKIIADQSAKPTQGSLFVHQRNLILGVDAKEFSMCKEWYKAVLVKYELWDEEKGLESTQMKCRIMQDVMTRVG